MGVISDHKKPTYKNKKYLAWMREKPCKICGQPGEPHHVRRHWLAAGMGKKSHDYATISRCRTHHDPQFEDFFEVEIIDNLMEYIDNVCNRKR